MKTDDTAPRAGWAPSASEERLQQLLDNTSAVVFAKDRQGRYIFANRELQRMVRLPVERILGRTDQEIWPPDLAQRFHRNDLQVLEQKRSIRFEEAGIFDGKEKTFLAFKFPLFDGDGSPCAVGGIATDISDRKRVEDALRSAALAVSGAEGASVFQELVRYLATILDVDIALIATFHENDSRRMHVLAFCQDGKISDNFDYPLAGTPCETVVGQAFRIYPERLLERFPLDSDFRSLGVESYAGYPLNDSQGRPLGLISAVSRRPLDNPEFTESVLKIFAVRAAAELERERAERAVRNSEASYKAIFEASEDAIFIHDWDTGAIVDVNLRACEAYGYSHEEMRRLGVNEVSSGVHPYTADEAGRFLQQARLGKVQRFEWHRRNKDGSLHWDEVVLKRAVISGEPRILAFTREITTRKAAELALRRSEDRLRAMVKSALDCIIVMDAQGNIIEFNPAAEACFGLQQPQAVGRQLADLLIPQRYREAHRRGMARYLETGQGPFLGRRVEVTAMRADGGEFPAELAIGVAEGAEGRIFIGYLRDITESRRAEEKRAQLEAQLRQAQKMEAIGHLTGGIAHDFNNLLTSIMGYIVLAGERQAGGGDARLAKYLEQAHLSCERARDLIQQMLTFSRGQRGEPRPVSLPPLVRESLKLIKSSLPSSIEIAASLEHEVPAVMLDPVQLDQVLLNLCINARDAMSGAGTVQVGVRHVAALEGVCAACRQAVNGDFVELLVADSGPGIAPEVLDRMFEPFFTTKEVGKGSGMGLATVHGIVHEHGGHLVVETGPGTGARFRVLFKPLQRGGPALQAAPAGRHGAFPRAALGGHVLVVDDEEIVGEFMRDLLESWGVQATVVNAVAQAREIFARDPARFDLVITDQTMPRMTGLELARELLLLRPGLPVILYTGYSDGITERDMRAAGIRALLRKPVEPHALFGLLQTLLPPAGV